MRQPTAEEYLKFYENSSQEIKGFLEQDSIVDTVEQVLKHNNIKDDKGELASIIGWTLVGLVPVRVFAQLYQEFAGLDAKTAKSVAQEVRQDIFAPIAETLAEMQPRAEESYKILENS